MNESENPSKNGQRETLNERFRRNAETQIAATENLLNVLQPCGSCDKIVCDARQRLEEDVAQTTVSDARDCHEGCNSCCRSASVDVTPLEAIRIANYMRENFSEQEIKATKERIKKNAKLNSQLSTEQRKHERVTCALLDDQGRCSVYEARPLICAGVFSLSKDACVAACKKNDDRPELSIPLDQEARVSVMGVSGGVQKALVNAGLDGNLYELHTVLERALDDPKAEQKTLAGKDVFKGCVCTDRHSPPRLRVDKPNGPKPKMLFKNKNHANAPLPLNSEGPVVIPIPLQK